jgi:hypothetical protein
MQLGEEVNEIGIGVIFDDDLMMGREPAVTTSPDRTSPTQKHSWPKTRELDQGSLLRGP